MRFPRSDVVLAAVLLSAQLAFVFGTKVLVGHDLPQHLAYTRLLADADAGTLPSPYAPPDVEDPYFTTYRLLALVARATSLDTSGRLVYALYAVGLTVAFFHLARAADETPRGVPNWTAALGPLLVWNPITCMGFLPFMLALPLAFGAVAVGATLGRRFEVRRIAVLVLLVAMLTAVHTAAAAMTGLAVLFLAVARRSRGAWLAVLVFVAAAWATRRALGGDSGRVDFAAWHENVRVYGVVDGTVGTFILSFAPPAMKAKLALATVLGPFPDPVKAVVLMALTPLVLVVLGQWKRAAPSRSRRALAIAMVLYLLATLLVPTAIQVPDDMCLIDFRMFVFVFAFALALLPRRLFVPLRARVALLGFAATTTAVCGWVVLGAGDEAEAAVALTRGLDPSARLLALSFHDRSAFFDEDNAVLHNLAVHFTARTRGTTTLFWGRFNRHLPIGYLPGLEPAHPPPWAPEEWTEEQVLGATHVFVSFPDASDDAAKQVGAARLVEEADVGILNLVSCRERFCLYEVRGRRFARP